MFHIKMIMWSVSIISIYYKSISFNTWADPEGRGGQGVRTHPEKSQKLGFPTNTGPDPLKNHKATKPAFNVGPSSARQRNAIKRYQILTPLTKLSGSAQ